MNRFSCERGRRLCLHSRVSSVPYTTGTSAISSTTYTPTSTYPSTGGSILQGHCTTAAYELIDGGPTVYYAPVVGCGDNRPDCCPRTTSRDVAIPTTAANAIIDSANQVRLSRCPDDYYSTADGCCPL